MVVILGKLEEVGMQRSDIDNSITLVNQSTSRYALSRVSISEYKGTRMFDYPYQPQVPRSSDDKYIYVTEDTRLDKIALSEYNDSKLWWVLAKVNALYNPLTVIKFGTTLRVPSMTTLIANHVIS